jgi:ATP-dependent RNA helicase RhlE
MSFDSLGLSAGLLSAVADQSYSEPTPVQRAAIPVILQGRDILAGAQTGTGKTAGFTLPLLQRLDANSHHCRQRRPVRALILVPTRELAAQVGESVSTYGRHLPLTSTTIFGGVGINPQIRKLRQGVDILVATPGRLLDHVSQQTLDLSAVEILVLDEADRMLDMGFIHDIRRIISLLPRQRQNLLFSATYSSEIRKLSDTLLVNPALIEVARRNTPAERVAQVVHPVDRERKRELLSFMIGSQNWRQVLVFTRTKHGANRLSQQLEQDGISSAAIHGNKSQGARTRALQDFKRGAVRVLVATDIAARGLDINLLPHVVNYELPNVPEDYVHRIGRTGRAGNEGCAVSLVCGEEHPLLVDIERLLKRDLPKIVVPGYESAAGTQTRPAPKRKPCRMSPNGKSRQPQQRKRNAAAKQADRAGKRPRSRRTQA